VAIKGRRCPLEAAFEGEMKLNRVWLALAGLSLLCSSVPAIAAPQQINATTQIKGNLPVPNGGTGATTITGTGSSVLNTGPTLTDPLIVADAAEPATPAAGFGKLYARTIAGRVLPKWVGPSGVDYPLQSHLGMNNIRTWRGGNSLVATTFASTLGSMNYTGASVTAPTVPVLATTNLLQSTFRSTLSTGVTAGGLAYIRSNNLNIWRGNAAGLGGFLLIHRFALSGTLQPGVRAFVGVVDVASNPTNIDPVIATAPGGVGMAINVNTGNWRIVNNVTGTSRTFTDLGSSFPVNNTDLLELILFSGPNSSSIGYRVTNLTTAAQTSGTLTTNLPTNTTFLAPTLWITNNATAAAQTMDFISTYLETDY
jgi:hypothetical protein